MSGGYNECPCINSTAILAEHAVDDCVSTGFFSGRTCYPADYGALSCEAHDMDVAPVCKAGEDEDLPRFCREKWCYVDFEKCKKSSLSMHRSSLFGDLGLYYSYSTCNGSNSFWQDFSTVSSLTGRNLTITVPRIYFPYTFKRDSNGNIIPDGWDTQEYYDDNIPFEGSYVNYMRHILRDSGVASLKFVSVSKGSFQELHSFTSTVLDVQRGISNMGLADFWVTPQRLNMTTFTVPLFEDRILLWVKAPQVDNSFKAKVKLTMMPFRWGLWGLLAGIIVLVSLLNVWFSRTSKWSTGERTFWRSMKGDQWRRVSAWHRIRTISGELGHALITSSLGFFVGAIESGDGVSLPTKVLHFGYGFLVLVVVGAYTANLVTFLTAKQVGFYYQSMEMAINNKAKICVLEPMRPSRWPNANFVLRNTEMEMLEAIDEGVCDSLLYGFPVVRDNVDFMEAFCDRQIVATKTEALSISVGFPVGNDIAAAVSYWMKKGFEEGNNIDKFNEPYQSPLMCPLEIDLSPPDEEEMNRLSISEMTFPLMIFFASAGLAVLIKMWKIRKTAKRKIKKSLYAGDIRQEGVSGSRESITDRRQLWTGQNSECGKEKDKHRSEANGNENADFVFEGERMFSDNELEDVREYRTSSLEPSQSSCVNEGALNETFENNEQAIVEQTHAHWKTDIEELPSVVGKFGSPSSHINSVHKSGMNEAVANEVEPIVNPFLANCKTDIKELRSNTEKSRATCVPTSNVHEGGTHKTIVQDGTLNETFESKEQAVVEQTHAHWKKDTEELPMNVGKYGSPSLPTDSVRMNEAVANELEPIINPFLVNCKSDIKELPSNVEKSRAACVPASNVNESGARKTIENEREIFLKQALLHAQKSEVLLRHIMNMSESGK